MRKVLNESSEVKDLCLLPFFQTQTSRCSSKFHSLSAASLQFSESSIHVPASIQQGCIVGRCLDFWHLQTPEAEVKFLSRTAPFNSSWGLTSNFSPKQKIFAILSNPVINIWTYCRQKTSWPGPVQWTLLLNPYQEAYLENKSLRTLVASLVIIRCWNYTRLF